MSAAMVAAVAALAGSVLTAVAAMYGTRGQNRASREATAVTGYDTLTKRLVAERDKAEADQARAEARAAAAEARASALDAELTRLRFLVTQLGGTP